MLALGFRDADSIDPDTVIGLARLSASPLSA
jgi:hypothetical protein